MTDLFAKLHHVCIVVPDIDSAQAYYEQIGIGPWTPYPPLSEYVELEAPDPVAFTANIYRVCTLPSVQLQLCQPGPGDTPQRQFLETKGPGVFHLGFEVPDADAAEADALARGIPVLMRGRRADGTGFDYYDTAAAAGVVLVTRETPGPAKR